LAIVWKYLVRFIAVRRSFPQRNSVTPDVGFGVELVKVDTLRCVPLQRPLPSTMCLIQWHYSMCL